jgi:hypothetical protein
MNNHSISSSSQKENCPTIKKCKQYQLSVCPLCGALRHREESEAIQTRGLRARSLAVPACISSAAAGPCRAA